MTPPPTMRVWTLPQFGLANLTLSTEPTPVPGPGQVLVAIRAVSLNYRDLLVIQGAYNPKLPLPLIPCSDAVGTVVALGQGVSNLAVGERVCGVFAQGWLDGPPTRDMHTTALGGPLPGTLTEYRVFSAQALVRPPSHLSDAQCATLPCAAVTAWRALVTEGGLAPGATLLTLGTGGVSVFAVQLGAALGARVAVTSRSQAKLDQVLQLGAAHGIHTPSKPEWGKAAAAWAGQGVDQVLELGGAGTLLQSLRAVRIGGTISLIGVLAGTTVALPLTHILMRHIRLQGIYVGNRSDFEALNAFLEAHPKVQPVVHQQVPFDNAPQALAALERQQHVGKVVIKV